MVLGLQWSPISARALSCYAGATGFEPAATGFGDRRSSGLSYTPMDLCWKTKNAAFPISLGRRRLRSG